MYIEEAIEKYSPKVALQFSGGRDSLAVLLLLKPYWNKLTVYFCNTGDEYPETLALVNAVKTIVPNFVEIQSSSAEIQKANGWPTDIAQAGASWQFGKEQIANHLKLNDRYSCCYQTMMKPTHERMKADGVQLIIRGQRDTDEPKSHVKSGDVVDGFTIAYPIVNWTSADVNKFIADCNVPLPPFYTEGLTSMPDCMHCTAWLEHGSYKYLNAHYPDTAKVVGDRLRRIKVVVEPFITMLDKTLQEE